MAFTAQAKLFLSDLSNYAEIRRGLSPAMRKATPTLRELRSVDAATQQGLINALNDYRRTAQREKIAASKFAEGIGGVFDATIDSGYYQGSEKVLIQTAKIKLKSMSKQQAEWELREALGAVSRLRDQDFYKANYYYKDNKWDPTLATVEMLSSFITGGGLIKAPLNVIKATFKEYAKRTHGNAEKEQSAAIASYHNDILNIAKMITY